MKKEGAVIIILLLLLVAASIVFIFGYFKGQELKIRNNQLEQERTQISEDKDAVMAQFEQCRTDTQDLNSRLTMLEQDVANIYKTCMTSNACKGKYPNIRWNCNNVGDETNVNPSHICVCDSACNMNATEIRNP